MMQLINSQTYVMKLAFIIAAVYSAEFLYLNIGVGVAFAKIVIPLALLLFAFELTWKLLSITNIFPDKSVTILSLEVDFKTAIKWNFTLTYTNILTMILKDYTASINGIPVYAICITTIIFLHICVGAIIMKLTNITIDERKSPE